MVELLDLKVEDWQGVRSDKFWTKDITKRATRRKRDNHASKKGRIYMKMDQRLVC